MQRKNQTRWRVIFFGVFMSFIMVASLLSGWLIQLSQQLNLERQQRALAEPTPLPTFEPPVSIDTVSFDRQALQANGLFTAAVPNPPEWDAIESTYDAFSNRARLLMRNGLNVVEVSAEEPLEPVDSLDALSEALNAQNLAASWRNYSNWTETQRITTEINGNEALQIDFELTFRSRTYVARQVAWLDNGRIYGVRVVTPGNATELLVFLLDEVANSLEVVESFAELPISWSAYYDSALTHVIRYPDTWQLTDAADGLPTSIEANGVVLRVEAVERDAIADEDAATAYAEALPFVSDVVSVEAVERGDLSGFSVAYTTQNLDGEMGSGAVVLLNGEDVVHVADLRVDGLEADLNAPAEDDGMAQEYAQVLATFYPLDGVEFAPVGTASAAPVVEEPTPQPNFGF